MMMRLLSTCHLLLLLLAAVSCVSAVTTTRENEDGSFTFESLTQPLPLYPGEVSNTWHHIAIPKGPIAISEFAADIVELDDDDTMIPVPLSDAYLHHHVVYSQHDYQNRHKKTSSATTTTQRSIGFGAGTESRGTRQVFPHPYRFTTTAGEDEFLANVHVINTRSMTVPQAHHCLECPCTAEDRFDPANQKKFRWFWQSSAETTKYNSSLLNTVVERRHHWDRCNAKLQNQSNTACSPSTYNGGLLCCEHGEFCLDQYYLDASLLATPNKRTGVRAPTLNNETQSTFYLRYTLTYTPLQRRNDEEIIPLYLAQCCDATGNLTSAGNIEYDIPVLCNSNTTTNPSSPACIHTLETIQTLHGASDGVFGAGSIENAEQQSEEWVDVVYMVGHLHRGGIEMTAYLAENNTLLCRSLPYYGTNNGSVGQIGNEPGYINRMSTCTFDPPRRMRTSDQIRVVGKYNATEAHTGVMSLFYIAVADVDNDGQGVNVIPTNGESVGFWKRFQRLASFCGVAIVLFATYQTFFQNRRMGRGGYEQVPSSTATSLTV
ncbi:Stress up-regulated Nod 19 [Seminavis robusta]|uniref:Stress up-regulated Nod 19 n=1 Tax=Seminavis robusta TaxID=568900 RepID=A0A9N8E8U6_9STRA|nr:Stress up-regulated Nod 19 [Seminavis robusta]|eukprot:Sro811_g205970.1 Stress up-regulated Nod 19 (546) ;mRNA; f:41641-43278